MAAVCMDIFKNEIDEQKQKARQEERLEAIRNVMELFGVSTDRAMGSLKIPQSQRATYAELVKRA